MPVRTTLLTRENKIPIYPRSDLSQIVDVKSGKDLKVILAELREEIKEGTDGVLERYDEVWASALNDLNTRLGSVESSITSLNNSISTIIGRLGDIDDNIEDLDNRVSALERKHNTGGNPDIEIDDGGGGGIAPNPDEEVEEIAP